MSLDSKSLEPGAPTSLARPLRDTNRPDEASGKLSDLYNWVHRGLRTGRLEGRQGVAG